MSEKLLEIANMLSNAAKMRIKPTQVHPIPKLDEKGQKSLDVYGVTISNNNGTYTIYLYAPFCKSKRIKSITIPAHEFQTNNIWQTGKHTYVGKHCINW